MNLFQEESFSNWDISRTATRDTRDARDSHVEEENMQVLQLLDSMALLEQELFSKNSLLDELFAKMHRLENENEQLKGTISQLVQGAQLQQVQQHEHSSSFASPHSNWIYSPDTINVMSSSPKLSTIEQMNDKT